ncbi:MAG: hypothetical protein LBJ00_15080 [Planctomycetaceae bacterium]|jgi:hypothetical protein|nr:hypothetical protein [Planctomycetaceae bacterium]
MRVFCGGVVIFWFCCFVVVVSLLADEPVGFESADCFAITAVEKAAVLDKAEATLKWVLKLSQEEVKGVPSEVFRTKITPLELMQAAAIMREQNQIGTSVKLREIISYFNPTSAECFEIEERLGSAVLDLFKEDVELPQVKVGGGGGWEGAGLNSSDFIKKGAAKFLKEDLTAAEKIAIMDSPKTAADLMHVVDLLSSTGRASLTRHYLKRFIEVKASPLECAEIVDKIGVSRLMRISVNRQFAPQGEEVVTAILREAKKHWQDTGNIAKITDNIAIKFDRRNLGNERSSLDKFNPPVILPESLKTLQTIWKGEHVSAAQLLSKLAETNDETQVNEIITVLLSIGGDVKESLAVSLNSGNLVLLKNAIRGLQMSISREEVFLLYPIAFSQKTTIPDEIKNEALNIILSKTGVVQSSNNIRNEIYTSAVRTLCNRARDYYLRKRHLRADENGNIRFWNWNDIKASAEYVQLTLPDAYRLFAYRYALLAYEIADEGGMDFEFVRRVYVAALFEYVSYGNGLDNPLDLESSGLFRVVSSLPLVQLNRVMTDAILEEHFEVARVAVKVWAHAGNLQSFIDAANDQTHPLIHAIAAPDRRLRFAALETIMQLNPNSAYQGSSLVAETLVWFARAEGRKIVVVIHPNLSEASRLAGYFIPLGYANELAANCRRGFMLAAESPDVELVVIDLANQDQAASAFAQILRKDNRTHDIPVAIYKGKPQKKTKTFQGNPNTLELQSMQMIDRLTPNASFVNSFSQIYPQPANDEITRFIEADLMRKTGAIHVPAEIRVEQAKKAVNWIKQTITSEQTGQKIYKYENLEEIVSRAVNNCNNIISGLEIAAELKSANMQSAIYNSAADATLPLTTRQKAAQLFEKSIKKHGILLRGKQVQYLYDRYNASEFETKESQDLLSRIIDVVEENAKKLK